MKLVNDIPGPLIGVVGYNRVAIVERDLNPKSLAAIIMHEIGHNLGMYHTDSGLMYGYSDKGFNANPDVSIGDESRVQAWGYLRKYKTSGVYQAGELDQVNKAEALQLLIKWYDAH